MAISGVEFYDWLVFKGEFALKFCPGVNVIIGGNGTGKTTLLRRMYEWRKNEDAEDAGDAYVIFVEEPKNMIYIPEKDMLAHSRGLPETTEYGGAEFECTEIDIIKKARVLPHSPEQPLYRKICGLIGGEPEHDGQSFFMKRKDVGSIHFSREASGYRRFGLLALLIRNEQISPGSVLFWDEPENSLNPELISKLVEILLELADSGVQIFLATHDYGLARYFDVRKDSNIRVEFHNLTKVDEQIIYNSSSRYLELPNNLLEKASADLFDAVVDAAMEVQDNE